MTRTQHDRLTVLVATYGDWIDHLFRQILGRPVHESAEYQIARALRTLESEVAG